MPLKPTYSRPSAPSDTPPNTGAVVSQETAWVSKTQVDSKGNPLTRYGSIQPTKNTAAFWDPNANMVPDPEWQKVEKITYTDGRTVTNYYSPNGGTVEQSIQGFDTAQAAYNREQRAEERRTKNRNNRSKNSSTERNTGRTGFIRPSVN